MLSDLTESHSPVFFLRWFALRFPVKTYAKKLGGAFCSLLLNDKQKKPFVFPNNKTSEASRSRLFFAYVFTRKWSTNQRKKIQGCDFLLNRRPHAKIQLIWTKKKKTKIRHRIVMLRRLQFWSVYSSFVCSRQALWRNHLEQISPLLNFPKCLLSAII